MNSHMRLEVALLKESPPARGFKADVLFQTHMSLEVHVEPLRSTVALIAAFISAFVSFNLEMRLHMVVKVTAGHERLLTTGSFADKGTL